VKVKLGHFPKHDASWDLVRAAYESGRLSYGRTASRYENAFAEAHHCRHGIGVSSGTDALIIALTAVKELYELKDMVRVAVPALTFVATYNAVLHAGMEPVLVDIQEQTYAMDPSALAEVGHVDIVIPVHMFGIPANVPMLQAIKPDAVFVEDCAEAAGAEVANRKVGSLGHIGCFSTYMAHHVVTGTGGMITTNDSRLMGICRSLSNHGISLENLPSGSRYDPSFLGRNFHFVRRGYSSRITEFQAALGLPQVETLAKEIARRRHVAEEINRHLAPLSRAGALVLPREKYTGRSSWMVFPIQLGTCDITQPEFKEVLRENGIEARDACPLTNQPYLQGRVSEDAYPVAKRMNQRGVYVPCNQAMNDDLIEYMCDVIKGAVS
jgi:CDP-6-deoxy-D-xylo-4-hexulose-3-dehydrase